MVDEGRIAFRPAVELSYLQKEEQGALLEQIAYADATPSLAQAIKLKRFSQDGKLNNEVIESIMSEEKPNQREKINITNKKHLCSLDEHKCFSSFVVSEKIVTMLLLAQTVALRNQRIGF